MKSPLDLAREFFSGLGYGWSGGHDGNLAAGNRGNPPGRPPSPVGSWQYIIPQMYADQRIVGIESTPFKFRDWNEFGVNVMDSSGQTGGGAASPSNGVPVVKPTQTAVFNTATGSYDFQWRDDDSAGEDYGDDEPGYD